MEDIAADAGGLGFDSRVGQIRHSIATAAMLLRNCVAQQALVHVGVPRHWLGFDFFLLLVS